jgi:Flp pilus assembly protein TadD
MSKKIVATRNKTIKEVNTQENTFRCFPSIVFILLIAGSLVVISAAHWSALSAKALCVDDYEYLVENPLVTAPSWNSAARFLKEMLDPSTVGGYYQPLTMISLMLDYARGHSTENLRVFHETSLVLHLLNTALIIFLIYQLFGRVWVAIVAGLLFGLHPMTVETIAWVGERKTVLAAFFSLLSLNFYVRYARRGGWKFYCLTVLTYILALMSKPTSTPLPILMLILDYWPLRRLGKASLIEKLPLLLLGGISGVITIISQSQAGIHLPSEYDSGTVPLMICYSLMFYISKIFYPINLSSHYPFPAPFTLSQPMILTAVIGVIILMVIVGLSLLWTRSFLAGLLFFFIGLLPTMQIIGFSKVIASDKFAYIPALGLLIAIGWLLLWLWDRTANKKLTWLYRSGMLMVVFIAAQREMAATRHYLVHWQDTEGHALYMLEMSPNAPEVYNFLGFCYYKSNDTDKAIRTWWQGLAINPNYDPILNNLAWLLATDENRHNRDGHKAVLLASKACQLTGYKNYDSLVTLARAYTEIGKNSEAFALCDRALALKPNYEPAHELLANTFLSQYKIKEAVAHYKQAVALRPNAPTPTNNLALLLATVLEVKNRDVNEAILLAKHACSLTHYKNASVLGTLAAAYASAGRFPEAIDTAQSAINLADASNQPQVKEALKYYLSFYTQGKPYIESVPKTDSNSNRK